MMKGLLLWIGLFLCALVTLFWGLLSMFSPRTLERFTEWYTRADKWSTRKPRARAQGSLSQRVAGFFVTLMGTWMTLALVSRLLRFHVSTTAPTRAMPSESADHHWSALVGGLVIIGFGVYMTLSPQISLRLMRSNFPNRELSKDAVNRALSGGRILGALTALFGAFLLLLWYQWTH
jgi:hypothetical protein